MMKYFLGNSPVWFKNTMIAFLIFNILSYFVLGPVITAWIFIGGQTTTGGGGDRDNANNPSEDEAIDKLKKALSDSNEGLIQLYHGKSPDHRLSKDTQDAMKAHNYRMSSSDC